MITDERLKEIAFQHGLFRCVWDGKDGYNRVVSHEAIAAMRVAVAEAVAEVRGDIGASSHTTNGG